jgi:hypothetical protein
MCAMRVGGGEGVHLARTSASETAGGANEAPHRCVRNYSEKITDGNATQIGGSGAGLVGQTCGWRLRGG